MRLQRAATGQLHVAGGYDSVVSGVQHGLPTDTLAGCWRVFVGRHHACSLRLFHKGIRHAMPMKVHLISKSVASCLKPAGDSSAVMF